jgi:hypothetical protein
MDEITKVAPQLMLYLYNNCVFIIKRNIILDNFKCLIYTVIYDADASDAEIESNTSRIIHDIPITGPSQCNGYAYSNNVIVWVPADLSKCPFKNEALNNQIYDGTIESAADSMDDHNYTVAINFNKLNIAPIKNSNKNAIDILFSDLSEDKIKNAKFYIALNYRSKIATLKHELTHVLDSETADKVNYIAQLLVGKRNSLNTVFRILVAISRIHTNPSALVGAGNSVRFEHNPITGIAFHIRYVGIELSLANGMGYVGSLQQPIHRHQQIAERVILGGVTKTSVKNPIAYLGFVTC